MTSIQDFINNAIAAQDGSNHFQFQICTDGVCDDKKGSEAIVITTALSKEHFYMYMKRMMDIPYKYYQKQYKEMVVGHVNYYNYNNEDVQVFNITTNAYASVSDGILGLAQSKNKLSILGLPSTRHIYDESIKKKLIFRITNRVFVNFEHGIQDGETFYTVYLNYNHEKDVDITSAISTIEKVLRQMKVAK